MVVGQDVAVFVEDDAGADAAEPLRVLLPLTSTTLGRTWSTRSATSLGCLHRDIVVRAAVGVGAAVAGRLLLHDRVAAAVVVVTARDIDADDQPGAQHHADDDDQRPLHFIFHARVPSCWVRPMRTSCRLYRAPDAFNAN